MTDVMPMPPPGGFFLDANLLVLLVAGRADTAIIARHRRLSRFLFRWLGWNLLSSQARFRLAPE